MKNKKGKFLLSVLKSLSVFLSFYAVLYSCTGDVQTKKRIVNGSEMDYYAGKGVGPIKEFKPGEPDSSLAAQGKELFEVKCSSCHKVTKGRAIGPGLLGITLRRTPEWILNQILNPIGMAQSDSMAKELLSIYLSQMTPMNISEEEAKSLFEYFRQIDMADVSGK